MTESVPRSAAFHVRELDCAHEAQILRDALARRDGILTLSFDVLHGRMRVQFDGALVDEQGIISMIAEAGLTAQVWSDTRATDSDGAWRHAVTAAAAGLAAVGFVLHWNDVGDIWAALGVGESLPPWTARIAYLASIACGLTMLGPKAVGAVRGLRLDMNVLIVVAAAGAVVLGEWLEAATVTFLFCVALLLEQWSVGRARRAIRSLLDRAPARARVRGADGSLTDTPVEAIAPGERLVIRPGERIPLDSVVVEGISAVDQAPITGESIPAEKQPGDPLFAGTINGDGLLEADTTHRADDSVLARILLMVEESQARQAPVEQWVERFARYYTPSVLGLAAAMAVLPPLVSGVTWAASIYFALVLLVIACPCALVISTPVSIVAGLTSAARHGVLIKGGRYLEAFARLDALALDKTGTLTRGEPEVQQVLPLEGSTEEVLALAAALDRNSTHPVARAIQRRAAQDGAPSLEARDYRHRSGWGSEAEVDGRQIWLGGRRLLEEKAAEDAEALARFTELSEQGVAVSALGSGNRVLGFLTLADTVREDAADTVAALRQLGVNRIRMLTGDLQAPAQQIADAVGIDDLQAEVLPEAKAEYVQQLRAEHNRVAMIGDGVNDSPALAAAHVGVAMAAAGSDAAIETADVALMSDDLAKLVWLIQHARRTLAIIHQNIAFALGLKLLFFALAAMGAASLWMAIAADMGASLLVIFNALRLLRP